ncbi:MAG: drug/metabolite transporter (DMT)-like permease [Lysobacterales bacterium]
MSLQDHSVEQDSVQAITLMIGSVFMMSTMDLAIKQLVEHYPSIQVVFFRCAFSAPVFAAWILFTNRSLFRPRRFKGHLLRAALGLVMLYTVGECFREMPLADAYAIFFAAPLLITLLSGVLMKEPAGPLRMSASLIGFVGVLIVLKPGSAALISYGSIMGLIAVVSYAFVALLLRSLGRQEHTITISFWFTALIGGASGLLAIKGWKPVLLEHWPWLLTLGISGTCGQIMLTAAFRRASAAVIAPYDYLHMIWAVFFGWWFWGDLPGGRVWVGSTIIVGSGLYILYREHKLKKLIAAPISNPDIPVL